MTHRRVTAAVTFLAERKDRHRLICTKVQGSWILKSNKYPTDEGRNGIKRG